MEFWDANIKELKWYTDLLSRHSVHLSNIYKRYVLFCTYATFYFSIKTETQYSAENQVSR